jgi:anaerobic ribonucleoside-triphosphate reductase
VTEELEKINERIEELEKTISDKEVANGTAQTMTRCSGYYRAVENMNTGKQREVVERVPYAVED